MALIGLFFLTTLLLFLNVEPFKTIGVCLSVCYLPGLFFFALAKRDKLFSADLLLAFPCSIGISSLLTLAMLFLGIQVEHVVLIIHVIVGAAVGLFAISRYREKSFDVIDTNKQQLIFYLFAFLITLLLSIPFFLGLNRMGIASHAFHHSLMVTQILNGVFPPENPGLGGAPIGYYWGFHSLIAAITAQTNMHNLQIIFILNVLSLYLIFCISYSFAKAYNLSEIYCYIFPIAVLGLMRSDAVILFLTKLFSGALIPTKDISSPLLEPLDVLTNWLRGVWQFDSRLLFLKKFYNVSGMPLAIGLCLSYLFLLQLTLRRKFAENKTYFVSIGIIVAACFFNYPPLAIFLLLHAPIWTIIVFLSNNGDVREKIREASSVALPYIAACLVVSPYLIYIMMSRDVSSHGQGGIFRLDFYDQSLKNIIVFLMPVPVIIYGIWVTFKQLSFSRDYIFLTTGTALSLFLSVFTRWPFDNSYKFNYILAFFIAFFFVLALSHWLRSLSGKWLKSVLAACVVIIFSLNPLLIEASYLVSYCFTDYRYAYSGRHIIWAQDKSKNGAYAWIRDNTPGNSLLMLSYTETVWPCCGINTNYETAAIAERTLYVIKDKDYTVSDPEYDKRILFREKLFESPEDRSVIDFFYGLNRPVYLLIEDNLEEGKFLVEKRFKPFSQEPGKQFVLVFQNEKQRVYRIAVEK